MGSVSSHGDQIHICRMIMDDAMQNFHFSLVDHERPESSPSFLAVSESDSESDSEATLEDYEVKLDFRVEPSAHMNSRFAGIRGSLDQLLPRIKMLLVAGCDFQGVDYGYGLVLVPREGPGATEHTFLRVGALGPKFFGDSEIDTLAMHERADEQRMK